MKSYSVHIPVIQKEIRVFRVEADSPSEAKELAVDKYFNDITENNICYVEDFIDENEEVSVWWVETKEYKWTEEEGNR